MTLRSSSTLINSIVEVDGAGGGRGLEAGGGVAGLIIGRGGGVTGRIMRGGEWVTLSRMMVVSTRSRRLCGRRAADTSFSQCGASVELLEGLRIHGGVEGETYCCRNTC